MERQFETAKFDLARKLLVEKVTRLKCHDYDHGHAQT
jgi:hypothetical protein